MDASSGVWALCWNADSQLYAGTRKDGIVVAGRTWKWAPPEPPAAEPEPAEEPPTETAAEEEAEEAPEQQPEAEEKPAAEAKSEGE